MRLEYAAEFNGYVDVALLERIHDLRMHVLRPPVE